MSTNSQVIPSSSPDLATISEADWAEAKHRETLIRPLAEQPTCSKSQARIAAQALGLSERRRIDITNALFLPRAGAGCGGEIGEPAADRTPPAAAEPRRRGRARRNGQHTKKPLRISARG